MEHPPVSNSDSRYRDFSQNKIVIFLIATLLVMSMIAYGLGIFRGSDNSSDTDETTLIEEKHNSNIPYALVYGVWNPKNSQIFAHDLASGTEYNLASLPLNIKKVSMLPSNKLVYASNTDIRDHAGSISIYDLTTNESKEILTASQGFGIDDYVLSPNKEFIAVWEVQVNPASGVLSGGRSRVYTANMNNPNEKNLIYDEYSTELFPLRYPRAILDDGTVFTDKFLPNSGAGWSYGMSVSNFDGTQKSDIDTMQNGSYGSQPIPSPDGRFLAFAGYDGSKGAGTNESTGFRQAIVSTNTVEILDTVTYERTILSTNLPGAIYSEVQWGRNSDKLFYAAVSQEQTVNGTYQYSLNTDTAKKLYIDSDYKYISQLTDDAFIAAKPTSGPSLIGNLGDSYGIPYANFLLIKNSSSQASQIETAGYQMQYIDVIGNPTLNFENKEVIATSSQEELQLHTFYIKPTLAERREEQQSQPPVESSSEIIEEEEAPKLGKKPACWALANTQCNEILGANYTGHPDPLKEPEYYECFKAQNGSNAKAGLCQGSPLYLYGPAGLKVQAKVHTPVYNSNAQIDENIYKITLGKNGDMFIADTLHKGIEYDYTPAVKTLKPPTYGTIVSKATLKETLSKYAYELGLNEKETKYLIEYGSKSITSPYAFISFYDHETSHAILPITFEPKPDIYRNIVFYIKNLENRPNYSIEKPHFESISRKGFTAIEISFIVE